MLGSLSSVEHFMSEYFRSSLVPESLLFSCWIFCFYYISFHTSLLQNTADLFSCIIKILMYFSDLLQSTVFYQLVSQCLVSPSFLLAPAHQNGFFSLLLPHSSQAYSLLLFGRNALKVVNRKMKLSISACSIKSE